MTTTAGRRRPLLAKETRDELRALTARAQRHLDRTGTSRAYDRGVVDVLDWLCGEPMTPMLAEVTR